MTEKVINEVIDEFLNKYIGENPLSWNVSLIMGTINISGVDAKLYVEHMVDFGLLKKMKTDQCYHFTSLAEGISREGGWLKHIELRKQNMEYDAAAKLEKERLEKERIEEQIFLDRSSTKSAYRSAIASIISAIIAVVAVIITVLQFLESKAQNSEIEELKSQLQTVSGKIDSLTNIGIVSSEPKKDSLSGKADD